MTERLRSELRVLAVLPGRAEDTSFGFARRQVDWLGRNSCTVRTFFVANRLSVRGIWGEIVRLREDVRAFRPDVVHAHYGTATALVAALAGGASLVVTFRGSDLNPAIHSSWLRDSLARFLSQLAALRCKQIICVSQELKNRLWWRQPRVHVIPSGVNDKVFSPIPTADARNLLGFEQGIPLVLFNAGNTPQVKGLELAEAAMQRIQDSLPNARMVVMRATLSLTQVALHMNACDCLLVTSVREGSPNVVKEALACNLPIVSVDVGDVVERVRGVNPGQITPRDPARIADAAIRILRQPRRSDGREKALVAEDDVNRRVKAILEECRT